MSDTPSPTIAVTQERRPALCLREGGAAVLLYFLLLVPAVSGFAAPAPPRVYTLASGGPQGVYFPLAQGIVAVAHKAGVEIRVLPSEGSKQNLAWLADGRADLALTQSDTAWDAYEGRNNFQQRLTGLRAIAPLYTEAIHILIHRPLYIHRLDDLRGKRIAVGPAGSGTEANATQVLAASGLTLDEVDVRRLSVEEAMAALRRGELDAAFVTSGVPSAAVTGVLADGSALLFEPDGNLLERLRDACPFFLNKNIEKADYPNLTEQVTTAGVQALLVGRSDLPAGVVDRLVHAISASPELVGKYHLTEKVDAAADVAIPMFDAAQRYYANQTRSRQKRSLLWTAAVVLVLSCFAFIFRRRLEYLLRRKEFLRVGTYFLVLWFVGSYALYWTEHRVNENYASLPKSLWSGLITIYSLSNKEPLTLEGRIVGVIVFALGLGGFVWLGQKLLAFYVKDHILPLLRGGFARMHKMKDHYVIAGWNEKGLGIMEQLHNEDCQPNRHIFILAKEGQNDHLESHGLIQIERGERASEANLNRVHVLTAHAVIILAESDKPEEDATTILAILAIRKICSDQRLKKPLAVIAEIFDPKNVKLATFAGADPSIALEIVSTHEVGEKLLSHAAVHPGLLEVHNQLLAFSKGHSEIHRERIPDSFAKSFDELLDRAAKARSNGIYVLPIAIQRGSDVQINPTPKVNREDKQGQEPWVLQNDDYLFAICDSPEDLKRLFNLKPPNPWQQIANTVTAVFGGREASPLATAGDEG
jgi:uncharacterized protein